MECPARAVRAEVEVTLEQDPSSGGCQVSRSARSGEHRPPSLRPLSHAPTNAQVCRAAHTRLAHMLPPPLTPLHLHPGADRDSTHGRGGTRPGWGGVGGGGGGGGGGCGGCGCC